MDFKKKLDKKIYNIHVVASVWPLYPIFVIAICIRWTKLVINPILPSGWSVYIKPMFDKIDISLVLGATNLRNDKANFECKLSQFHMYQ